MLGKAWIISLALSLSLGGLALSADQPADYSRETIAKAAPAIAQQLRSANPSDRQNALEIVRKAAQSARKWRESLSQMGKHYENDT